MGATSSRAAAQQSGQIYRCFLVRCRLEGTDADGRPAWRFTVQRAGADMPRHSFTSLQDVAACLEAELRFSGTPARAPNDASDRS